MNSLYNATARNCTIENGTCTGLSNSPSSWYYSSYNVTFVVLYALVIAAALIGNTLVCLAVCINANLRQNTSSYFIVSLAISDIGTTCFSMTFDLEAFIMHRRWYHGEALCVIWTTAYLITVPSSIWNLFILSIDRYKTLKNPWKRYKESHSLTTRRAVIAISFLWIYCLAFALLPVMGWKTYPKSVKNNYCRFNISVNFSIVGSVFNFYLPIFAMCYIYYKVYQIARAHIKFPMALKRRYDTGSGKGSGGSINTAETVGRMSVKQHRNSDPTNQETTNREVVGLENISFCLEENLESKSIKTEEQSTEKEEQRASEHDDAVDANPLGITDIDYEDLSNKPRITNQCKNTRTDDSSSTEDNHYLREHRYDLKGCDNTDKDVQHLEKKNRPENKDVKNNNGAAEGSTEPENKELKFFSDELAISTQKTKLRSVVENAQCAVKEKNSELTIPKSATWEVLHSRSVNDNDVEKLEAERRSEKEVKSRGQEGFSDKSQLKTSMSLNSFKIKRFYDPSGLQNTTKPAATSSPSDNNSLCKRNNKFLFGKPSKKSEAMNNDESCSLRKFRKRSIEDESIDSRRESSSESKNWPPGELKRTFKRKRDSLTRSNQRRLKLLSKNKKAARTISIIVGAFLICWVPFTTMSIAYNICSKPCWKLIPFEVFDVLLWLGYLNSALNPVIFSYRNMQFRSSYRQIAGALLSCLPKQ